MMRFRQGSDTALAEQFGSCLAMLQELGGTQLRQTAVEDESIQLWLPESILRTITRHGAVGVPAAPQQVQCELRNCRAVVTWQSPDVTPVAVAAYAVQRSVGGGEFEDCHDAPILEEVDSVQHEEDVRALAGQLLLYRVQAVDTNSVAGVWSAPVELQLPDLFAVQLQFTEHFDTNGVLYHLATDGDTSDYSNPHTSGMVVAAMSRIQSGSAERFVQHHHDGNHNYTDKKNNSWMAVDLGEGRTLVPDHYCLRSGKHPGAHKLRNWELQGSEDGNQWHTLLRHDNDTSLGDAAFSTAAWPVEADGRSFRHFRVHQHGQNSSSSQHLMCCGIELYGTLVDRSDDSQAEVALSSDDVAEDDDDDLEPNLE